MPYPNEHAARVKDPGLFEEGSFRTKKLKDGLRVILGKLKGESSMTAQAYRFTVDKFTVEQAKTWLKDNNISFIKFEPATNEVKQSMTNNKSLQHVGIMGMRWGVRKGGGGSSRSRGSHDRGGQSNDHTEARRIKGKHLSEMSNDEIQKLSKRLRLEKEYKDLNPDAVARGKKSVETAIKVIGTTAALIGSAKVIYDNGKKIFDYVNKAKGVAP